MRKIFSNISFLVCLVMLCWSLGIIWLFFGVNSDFILNVVRMSAGIPIVLLSMRKTVRLGWMEVFERQAEINDLNSRWTSDDGWDKKMERNNRLYDEQYKDYFARVLFIWLFIIELIYFFSVPLLYDYISGDY